MTDYFNFTPLGAGGNLMVVNSGSGSRSVEFYNVDNTTIPDCMQGTKDAYPEMIRKPALFTNPG